MTEVGLPHQIRAMSSVETDKGRKIMAGFSTGEYGIISLPILRMNGNGRDSMAVLGDCFTPPFPQPVMTTVSSPTSTGLGTLGGYGERFGGIGGLAKATGNVMGLGALGSIRTKKLDKNLVVTIPSLSKGKGVELGRGNEHSGWLFAKEWGWEVEDLNNEDEVIVSRDCKHSRLPSITRSSYFSDTAMPISASGRPRLALESKALETITYANPPDEIAVLSPYILSLIPPISASPSPNTTSNSTLLINSVDSLATLQSLQIPPTASPTHTDAETIPSRSTARLLTVATSTFQSPVLILTSKPSSTPSIDSSHLHTTEQTIWIVTMKSWENQIEELGKLGKWNEAIRFLRKSNLGGSDVSVSFYFFSIEFLLK